MNDVRLCVNYGNISYMASKGLKMEYFRAFIILVFGFCMGLNLHILHNYFSCINHEYSTTEHFLLSVGLIDNIKMCPPISETLKAVIVNLLLFGIVPIALATTLIHLRNLLPKETKRATEKAFNNPLWIDGYITTDKLDGFNKGITVAHIEILHCGRLKIKVVNYNHGNDVWMIPVKYEDEEID